MAVIFSNFFNAESTLLTVLVVGVLWEGYEVVVSRSKTVKKFLETKFGYYIIPPTFSDTALDLLLNVLGAAFYLYLYLKNKKLAKSDNYFDGSRTLYEL